MSKIQESSCLLRLHAAFPLANAKVCSALLLMLCLLLSGCSTAINAAQTDTQASRIADPNDWCAGHAVPESMCTLCHPELISQFKAKGDFCDGTQLPQSVCPNCNPMTPPGQTTARVADPNDWCAGHAVPESMCTLCHPELIAQFKAKGDFCEGTQLPQSVCPNCNPMTPPSTTNAAVADWCAGHAVPESMCTLCHPQLIPQFQEAGDWCAEHQLPESVCPACNPDNLSLVPIEQRIVRFIDPSKEAEVGIETMPVRRGNHGSIIQAPARVAFNADQLADLRTVIPGLVQKVHIELGAQVTQGQALFELTSPRIAQEQAHLRKAQARSKVAKINLERQRTLAERQIASAWDLEQAEIEYETAQAELAEAQITLRAAGANATLSPGLLTIKAPISGTLIKRPAVVGTMATDETSLGMIADTSQMWIFGDIPEHLAQQVHIGDLLHFQSGEGLSVRGRIDWIAPEVDATTRAVSVRANVANPNGSLRANQFGNATIEKPQSSIALLVPAAAIQQVEDRDVVFVRHEQGVFQPREVSVLASTGAWLPVNGNLSLDDQVVTTGAVLLRTEMLPGSIGAGCCEVEPLGATNGGH